MADHDETQRGSTLRRWLDRIRGLFTRPGESPRANAHDPTATQFSFNGESAPLDVVIGLDFGTSSTESRHPNSVHGWRPCAGDSV